MMSTGDDGRAREWNAGGPAWLEVRNRDIRMGSDENASMGDTPPPLEAGPVRPAERAPQRPLGKNPAAAAVVWLAFLLGLFSPGAWADGTTKIGIVDLRRVMAESRLGKQAREKFWAEVKTTEAELSKEKQELERLKSDLEKKAVLLGEEEKLELERQFQRKYRDYLQEMQDAQRQLQQRERELTARILDDLREVVAEIGKKEAFTFIFDRSRTLYAGKTIDITDRVLKIYDQRNSTSPATGN